MPRQEGTDAHPTCSTGRRPGFAIQRQSRTKFAVHTVRARGDKTAEHEREMPGLWPTPETSATPSLAPPSSRFYAEGELALVTFVKDLWMSRNRWRG
jgi:hypothetical protein